MSRRAVEPGDDLVAWLKMTKQVLQASVVAGGRGWWWRQPGERRRSGGADGVDRDGQHCLYRRGHRGPRLRLRGVVVLRQGPPRLNPTRTAGRTAIRAHSGSRQDGCRAWPLPGLGERPGRTGRRSGVQVDDASVKLFHPLTLPELPALIEAMPPRHRLMSLLAGWRGLRFGELTGLCRFDVGLAAGVPRVRRGVARADRQGIASAQGRRAILLLSVTDPLQIVCKAGREEVTCMSFHEPGSTVLLAPVLPTMAGRGLRKAATGISGLDEVTSGGLPARPSHPGVRSRRLRQDLAGHGVPGPRHHRVRRTRGVRRVRGDGRRAGRERRLDGLRPAEAAGRRPAGDGPREPRARRPRGDRRLGPRAACSSGSVPPSTRWAPSASCSTPSRRCSAPSTTRPPCARSCGGCSAGSRSAA